MKKRTKIGLMIVLILLLGFTMVYAQPRRAPAGNQFQELVKLVADAFGFVEQIFSLPLFGSPARAFGILIAFSAIIVFAILYGLTGLVPIPLRIRMMVCGALTAMIAVLMNFQPRFFYALFGNWITGLIFIMMSLVVVVMLILIFRLPSTPRNNWIKAGLSLITLLIVGSTKAQFATAVNNLATYLKPYPVFLPFGLIFNKRKKKSILSMVLFSTIVCAFAVSAAPPAPDITGPYMVIFSVMEGILMLMTLGYTVKGIGGAWKGAAEADPTMEAGGKLREWWSNMTTKDKEVEEFREKKHKYATQNTQLKSSLHRSNEHMEQDLVKLEAAVTKLEQIDQELGVTVSEGERAKSIPKRHALIKTIIGRVSVISKEIKKSLEIVVDVIKISKKEVMEDKKYQTLLNEANQLSQQVDRMTDGAEKNTARGHHKTLKDHLDHYKASLKDLKAEITDSDGITGRCSWNLKDEYKNLQQEQNEFDGIKGELEGYWRSPRVTILSDVREKINKCLRMVRNLERDDGRLMKLQEQRNELSSHENLYKQARRELQTAIR